MLYSFELQMIGLLLLPLMLAAGILVWYRKRRAEQASDDYPLDPETFRQPIDRKKGDHDTV